MIKFLVIRFSSIGDIVLTTPVVRCLKRQVDGAEIHFATKEQFKGILTGNPNIAQVHTLKNNFNEFIAGLKDEYFDYIIDLHHNLRTARVKNNLKVAAFSFNKLNIEKWLRVNLNINRLPDVHIVDRYMKTLSVFDVANDNQGLDYFIPESDEVNLITLPEAFRNGYAAFVIGAKHFTKKLPDEKIISICKKCDVPVILIGGEEDKKSGEIIASGAGKNIYNACGQFNLNGSASLVRQANTVITHDTGLMHIAAAFKKKIISVWGNTIPAFGMYPYLPGDGSEIIEVEGLKCRPCSKIGFRMCPKKHFRCMNCIDEDKIAGIVKRTWK